MQRYKPYSKAGDYTFYGTIAVLGHIVLGIYCIYGLLFKESSLDRFSLFLVVLILIFNFIAWKWLYNILSDPVCNKFSFDEKGIVFYVAGKSVFFPYNECAEIGFTLLDIGTVSFRTVFYVYLSRKVLSEKEKESIRKYCVGMSSRANKLLKYKYDYVMFHYDPEIFNEFLKCVPDRFRDQLIRDEKWVVSQIELRKRW